MNLKEDYLNNVTKVKHNQLNALATTVIESCKQNITDGEELPYQVTLEKTTLDTVHDLTRLLKNQGIECSAFFLSAISRDIQVTITDFI